MFKVNGQIYTHQEIEEQAKQKGWNDPEFLEWLSVAQPGSVFVDEMNEAPELETCFTVECVANVPEVSEIERLKARNVALVTALQQANECMAFIIAQKRKVEARAALKGE